MRIWHDNSGAGNRASWFMKYIVVRNLQTMEKNHFICQQWFAVEKGDGLVRLIRKIKDEWVKQFPHMSRLIDSYLLPVKNKRLNSPIYYRKRHIIRCLMVIFGFPSFHDRQRFALLVLNAARAALYYSSCLCE